MGMDLLNTSNKPICEDDKDYSTPAQDVDSGQIGCVEKNVEKDLYMDISDDDKPKDYGEVEIHKNMGSPEEAKNS